VHGQPWPTTCTIASPGESRACWDAIAKEKAMTARELMTQSPTTVTPTTTIAEAWDLMRELDVRHLPVVDGEALVGMVSDRDLGNFDVAHLLTEDGSPCRSSRS
jgi:CBS-domain-containing membrane protein